VYPPQPYQAPPAASPLDYLNQIAPQQQTKKPLFKGLRGIILIGLILVVIVSILALVVNLATSGQSAPGQQLAVHLKSGQTLADGAQGQLKSSTLRSLNSNLRIFYTNTNRDAAAPLLAAGVSVAKLDETAVANESSRIALVKQRLEDARLNAVYDRTYAREMAYELATLMALIRQVYNQSNDATLRSYLDNTYKNLEPTQASFAAYNEER
jgi:hypothetical protein